MRPQYDSWNKASHHKAAGCVDCHLPHALLPKFIAKADNGYRHSKGFTLQDFHEPILLTRGNARVLQENCIRCHADLIHGLGAVPDGSRTQCTHCHADVGHGEPLGLGKYEPDEIGEEP
jgi:cytochrome c nitrite reductase small subunit